MNGGAWAEKKYDYLHLPLMVRENSVVAVGACDDKPDYDYADGVELRVYALVDGQECSTTVYDMKQKEDLRVSIVKSGTSSSSGTLRSRILSMLSLCQKAISEQGWETVTTASPYSPARRNIFLWTFLLWASTAKSSGLILKSLPSCPAA